MNKVVITGVGAITPFNDFWTSIKAGNVILHSKVDRTIVNQRCTNVLKGELVRNVNYDSRLFVIACDEAIKDAELNLRKEDTSKVGISAGVCFGSIESYEIFHRSIVNGNFEPTAFSNSLASTPVAVASLVWKITGPSIVISGEFSVGAEAFIQGVQLIEDGTCEVVITGGWERISVTLFEKYTLEGLLSISGISRPFDKRRDGFVICEGAGCLVIESMEHALARGRKPYALVEGFGIGFGAGHDEIKRAMRTAYNENKIEMIDAIFASANSSIKLDKEEAMGIGDVFGKDVGPVTSIKSMVGETMGASGALSLISAVLSMKNGIIPPTVNCNDIDDECEIKIVHEPIDKRLDYVMINSIGSNVVSIILKNIL